MRGPSIIGHWYKVQGSDCLKAVGFEGIMSGSRGGGWATVSEEGGMG